MSALPPEDDRSDDRPGEGPRDEASAPPEPASASPPAIPPPPVPPPPSSMGGQAVPGSLVPAPPSDVAVERLPDATWQWWEAVVVYLVATVVTSLVLALASAAGMIDLTANDGPSYVATLVVGELAFATCVLFWVRVVHGTPLSILGPPVEPLRDLAVGIPSGVGLYVVAFLVGIVVAYVYQLFTGHQPSSPDQVPLAVTGSWLVITGLGVVLLAPFGEELLFRGMLFRGFRRRLAVWPAALASAALFSLGHLQGWSFFVLLPPLFCVGVGLALLYERRQSLLASMSAHATFNLIGFLFIFTSRR